MKYPRLFVRKSRELGIWIIFYCESNSYSHVAYELGMWATWPEAMETARDWIRSETRRMGLVSSASYNLRV